MIDNDGLSIHSMQSLGRVGRILSGSLEPGSLNITREQQAQNQSPLMESPTSNSPERALNAQTTEKKSEDTHSQSSNYSLTMNKNSIMLQEPDVIASTKLAHSKTTDSVSLVLS